MSLETMPRVTLAHLPTPLDEAPRLSAALGGPRIMIKRDDLTGLALGGNKARKLEFAMADAKQKGADVIITTGSSQSNHASQTAAAAARLGMQTYLILFRGEHPEQQGNRLLYDIYNAKVEIAGEGTADLPKVMKRIDDLAAELRSQGHTPYVMPVGALMPEGTVGYVPAVSEICNQLKELGTTAQYLVVCCGSSGTMAGLVVGAKYYQAPFEVVGMSVALKIDVLKPRVADMASKTARLLETDLAFVPEELTIYDDYIGERYGIPSKEGIAAIKLVAQTEGIILDPVYTGKTMAGLIDLVRKKKFTSKDTVIFMHTGGAPGVFAYSQELSG
ncbi:MAG: D-cysteine desulfhydrase family protein [Chloroflexi bacterium]|nr:D-cysteine desulfhydrase family protein [Chloroflexota bacterium]